MGKALHWTIIKTLKKTDVDLNWNLSSINSIPEQRKTDVTIMQD